MKMYYQHEGPLDAVAYPLEVKRCKACGNSIVYPEDHPNPVPLCPGKHTERIVTRGNFEILDFSDGVPDLGKPGDSFFEVSRVPRWGRKVYEMWWDRKTGERMGRQVGVETLPAFDDPSWQL